MGNFISDLFVDPSENMPDNGYGFVQVLFHGLVYGYVLFQSSNMISEGSELLLLTPYKKLVGSIVLPILGAVPDGAIILFSGSQQLAVGVGALAGSTIMLLTIPWFLAMVAGRVDIVDGAPRYSGKPLERLSPGAWYRQFFCTGISVDSSIRRAGYMMMLTSISYWVIQVPGFGLHCQFSRCDCADGDDSCIKEKAHDEKPWAWAGMLLAIVLFIAYLVDQILQSGKDDDGKRDRIAEEVGKNALKRGMHLDFSVFLNQAAPKGCCGLYGGEIELEDLTNSTQKLNFDRAIVKLFNKYNTTTQSEGEGPEHIDGMEVGKLLTDLHMTGTALWDKLKSAAEKGSLTLPRFSQICWDYVLEQQQPGASSIRLERIQSKTMLQERRTQVDDQETLEEHDEDEELEIPEDIADLTEAQQQYEIWKRSLVQMFTGTFIVMLFSDPMCDILASIGDRIHISAFYVSFVLAPLASNASELLAAYNYALKKTKKTMTISISTLMGAACMNNSFCLAIFLFKIVSADDQVWQYSSETISIIAVEYVMFFFALQSNMPFYYAVIIILVFPLSIGLVVALKAFGLD